MLKISMITVCYNSGDTIRSALASVFTQRHDSVEYIVVDGGSVDGTIEVIRGHRDKISKFVCEPDNGIYDAINKGICHATGDVIGLVHADDVLADESVLSDVSQEFGKHRQRVDAVYGDLVYVDRQDLSRVIRHWKSGDYLPGRLKFGWMPPHPALFVRRETYEKVALRNGEYFDTRLSIASDYDLMVRLLNQMNISLAYLPRVLVKMRVGGVSNRSLRDVIRKSWEDYLVMRRNRIGGIGTLISKNVRKLPQFKFRTNMPPTRRKSSDRALQDEKV